MALLPPGNSDGSSTLDHGELVGREQPNSHPISAVTGLSDWLAAHDRALVAAEGLRFIYAFSNTTSQTVNLPTPLNTPSLVVAVVRTSDGALIEPDIQYLYDTGPARYITGIRLGFTPAANGEHVVHVVR